MDQLQVTATFPNIASENLEAFKGKIAEAVERVKTEEGALQYDWFFSEDESRCVVREAYRDSDAVMAHMGNVGDLLGPMAELGGGLEIELFGEPSAELREAAAEMQPTVHSHFASA